MTNSEIVGERGEALAASLVAEDIDRATEANRAA
jgi:hypothetical protein